MKEGNERRKMKGGTTYTLSDTAIAMRASSIDSTSTPTQNPIKNNN
jgi:hypothetical protein